jgi:hypothetical protein
VEAPGALEFRNDSPDHVDDTSGFCTAPAHRTLAQRFHLGRYVPMRKSPVPARQLSESCAQGQSCEQKPPPDQLEAGHALSPSERQRKRFTTVSPGSLSRSRLTCVSTTCRQLCVKAMGKDCPHVSRRGFTL